MDVHNLTRLHIWVRLQKERRQQEKDIPLNQKKFQPFIRMSFIPLMTRCQITPYVIHCHCVKVGGMIFPL